MWRTVIYHFITTHYSWFIEGFALEVMKNIPGRSEFDPWTNGDESIEFIQMQHPFEFIVIELIQLEYDIYTHNNE